MSRRFIWLACGLTCASLLFVVVAGQMGRWAELAGRILVLVLACLGLVAFLIAAGRHFVRPKSFQDTHDVQTAPTSPAFHAGLAGQILMLGAILYFFVTLWHTEYGYLGWLASIVIIEIVVLIGAHLAGVLRGIPRLELTAQALVLRNPLGTVRLPWQALSPTDPVRHVHQKGITLNVTDRKLIERRGLAWRSGEVDLSNVAIDPQFLAESIHSSVVQAQSRQTS
jgi:hypothetical protein